MRNFIAIYLAKVSECKYSQPKARVHHIIEVYIDNLTITAISVHTTNLTSQCQHNEYHARSLYILPYRMEYAPNSI